MIRANTWTWVRTVSFTKAKKGVSSVTCPTTEQTETCTLSAYPTDFGQLSIYLTEFEEKQMHTLPPLTTTLVWISYIWSGPTDRIITRAGR